MKYLVPKDISAIYHEGRKYPVIKGIVEIPGKPVPDLQPVEQPKSDGKKAKSKE
jgi:predicted RNA-binding protein with PUA-like domain